MLFVFSSRLVHLYSANHTQVQRTAITFSIQDPQQIKKKLLSWASRFNTCCVLDNHFYESPHHTHEFLVAAGSVHMIEVNAGDAFEKLKVFSNQHQDWLFGHFSFDLKNEIERMSSAHPDHIGFADLSFFVPEIVVELNDKKITLHSILQDHSSIMEAILHSPTGNTRSENPNRIMERFSKEEYLQTVEAMRKHILQGDCYEVNFCQEFYAEDADVDPLFLYQSLSEASPTPFGAFYKSGDKYLLCASPERYLKKEGSTIRSEPIKGTESRDLRNSMMDLQQKDKLFHSVKDRSENIMVVDLVRNDLSKVCEEGSVKVDELYAIYSFPQVHQMISSVSGTLPTGTHWIEAIRATFPMGSMTGAPKKKVMELIERYEKTKRGLFSGAVGYLNPSGDFDFNVVIRSILYNRDNRYLSYQVGSGITFYSEGEKEYDECMVKVSAIRKVLGTH